MMLQNVTSQALYTMENGRHIWKMARHIGVAYNFYNKLVEIVTIVAGDETTYDIILDEVSKDCIIYTGSKSCYGFETIGRFTAKS